MSRTVTLLCVLQPMQSLLVRKNIRRGATPGALVERFGNMTDKIFVNSVQVNASLRTLETTTHGNGCLTTLIVFVASEDSVLFISRYDSR